MLALHLHFENRERMKELQDIRRPVEQELEQYIQLFQQSLDHDDPTLKQALGHIQQRRGKMMRPLLVLLVAKEFGAIGVKTLRSAVTLELLHTASLVHDDVVDNSAERRGQAAEHTLYGNKIAILVGDYLLSQSLHQASLTGDVRVVDIIAQLGGTLSEGEIRQLDNIRIARVSEEDYFHVIHHKTAALFEACARLGALSSNASEERVQAAAKLGEIIGLCFQVRDDIFDYYSDSAIGKPTGNDMAEGKLTLPALYALRKTDDAQSTDAQSWARRVKEKTATPDEIASLIEYTKRVGGIDYARETMENFRKEAMPLIATFTNEQVREALTDYLDYTIGRSL